MILTLRINSALTGGKFCTNNPFEINVRFLNIRTAQDSDVESIFTSIQNIRHHTKITLILFQYKSLGGSNLLPVTASVAMPLN